MTRQEAIQNQIDEIMDWFEFSKVAKTMKLLQWGWGLPPVVPEESKIRQEARRLLSMVSQDKVVSCGGFVARLDEGKYKDGKWVRVRLAFEVDSWGDGVTYEGE